MTQTCTCGHGKSSHFQRNTPGECQFCNCRAFVDVTDTLTPGEQAQILAYIRRKPGEPANMNDLPAWLLELERTRLHHNLITEENRRLNVQVAELVTTINGMVEGRNAERAGLKAEIAEVEQRYKDSQATIAEFQKSLSGTGFEIYHDPDGRIGLKNHECIYVPLPEESK